MEKKNTEAETMRWRQNKYTTDCDIKRKGTNAFKL